MSDRIPASLFVMPDPENMGIAVEITLLSCIGAERYVISFLLPVYGRHLYISTYPDVEPNSYQSLLVARS